MQKDAYTSQELAPILGMTRQGVDYKAIAEQWHSQKRQGRGGGRAWTASQLPEAVRLAIRTAEERKALEGIVPPAAIQQHATTEAISKAILDDKRRYKALAKADLIAQYLGWLKKHGRTEAQKEAFLAAYLGGAWPKLLQEFGSRISWKSLERWKLQQAEAGSVLALVDKRGIAHKGRSSLTGQHRAIILGHILNPNAPAVSECVRRIQKRCVAENLFEPSDATIRRYVKQYMEECYGEFVKWREGDKAWNDKCAISLLRDWSLVEVGDIVIADGHVLNFETLDPDTGKPKRMTLLLFYDGASNHPLGWEVMATENVACISAAFRRTCIILGKIPRVVYLDNGRAFRAKFFKGVSDFQQAGFLGLYRELGSEVIHAWAYHGQSKPVERFFGVMHDLEVFVPSYTGRSIDTKPARMKRGEVMHRKLYDSLGGRPLTMEETYMVLARWFDEYAQRGQRRSHLAGRSPAEVFLPGVGPGVDVERLTLLMMQREIKTISKDGIRHMGRLYWDEALANRRHPVLIRYDNMLSPHTVLVYSKDGQYICEARDRAHYQIACGLHPAARVLGTPEQKQAVEDAIALKRGQEKLAGASQQAMLEAVILPEAQRRQAELAQAAAERPDNVVQLPRRLPQMSAEDAQAIEEAKAQARAAMAEPAAYGYTPSSEMRFKDAPERYEYLFMLRHEQDVHLTPADLAWMEAFQLDPIFIRNYKPRFDQLRMLFDHRKAQALNN